MNQTKIKFSTVHIHLGHSPKKCHTLVGEEEWEKWEEWEEWEE